MISLEQIRLLESKISRAIELIRVLKEENATLRKGLESAQKRMKELEDLVNGFKTDQNEIESVIVRTLHNLDELEENVAAKHQERVPGAAARAEPAPRTETPSRAEPQQHAESSSHAEPTAEPQPRAESPSRSEPQPRAESPSRPSPAPRPVEVEDEGGVRVVKEELDIF